MLDRDIWFHLKGKGSLRVVALSAAPTPQLLQLPLYLLMHLKLKLSLLINKTKNIQTQFILRFLTLQFPTLRLSVKLTVILTQREDIVGRRTSKIYFNNLYNYGISSQRRSKKIPLYKVSKSNIIKLQNKVFQSQLQIFRIPLDLL